jgi:hypothetical protein
MTMSAKDFDVAVVGGCTTARLFASRGALVALVDFSSAREITPLERRAFQRASVDPVFARAFGKVLAREHSVLHPLDPRVAGRLLIPSAGPSVPA